MSEMKARVKRLLESYPDTRSDDRILFARLIESGYNTLTAEEIRVFSDIFTNSYKYGLPNFKSVVRLRADIQKNNPDLKDTEAVKIRKDREKQYRTKYGKTQ